MPVLIEDIGADASQGVTPTNIGKVYMIMNQDTKLNLAPAFLGLMNYMI
jgi:hypothetical protein